MADAEVPPTTTSEGVPEKKDLTVAPVKRDARLLGIPLRHTRAIVFVSLSLIVLGSPLLYYCLKYHDPDIYQLADPSHDPEKRSIRKNLGKGKEVFTLLAESVTAMPPGFYAFDRAITRIANDTHRLQRDLRGLVYLDGQRDGVHAVNRVAARIEEFASSLQTRTVLLDDLICLRTLLDKTARVDAPGVEKCNHLLSEDPDGKSIAFVREFLAPPREPPKAKPTAGTSSAEKLREAPSPTENVAGNTIAEINRHFNWKRTELVELIDITLWPKEESASSAQKRDSDAAPSIKRCMAHALTLQRIGNKLSTWSYWVGLLLACLVALFWYRMWVGRQYALGRGRWRAQLVFYVFIVLQIYNVILVGAYMPDAGRIEEDTISIKTASLKDAYKTATQEIYHRLEQEQHFYILKFTMIGSLLAVFFRFLLSSGDEREAGSPTNEDKSATGPRAIFKLRNPRDAIDRLRESKIAAFFFWAAVIINCIVDTRLRYNAIICSALGRWIRTLESSVEEYGMTGWETFFEQQAPISSSPLMQVAPTLLTTIVFVLTVVLFLAKEQSTVSLRGNIRDSLHPVNLVFGGIAFTIMGFSDLGQPGMPWEWAGPVLGWIVAGMAVLFLGPKPIHGRVFRRDEITDSLIGYAFPFHYFNFHNTPWRPERAESTFWIVHVGKFTWYLIRWLGVRLGSYVPFPPLRRRLVRYVNRSLELEFMHLEINRDPLLSDALASTSEGSRDATGPMVWSLLYLQAGHRGLKRLKRGLRRLNDGTESSKLAAEWLEQFARDFVLRDENHGEWNLAVLADVDPLLPRGLRLVGSGMVHYCRVHDYYDEHNPWIVFMWEISVGETAKVVLLSAKDVFSHQMGVAGRKAA